MGGKTKQNKQLGEEKRPKKGKGEKLKLNKRVPGLQGKTGEGYSKGKKKKYSEKQDRGGSGKQVRPKWVK